MTVDLAPADPEVELMLGTRRGEPPGLALRIRPRGEHPTRSRVVEPLDDQRGMGHGALGHSAASPRVPVRFGEQVVEPVEPLLPTRAPLGDPTLGAGQGR